MLIPCGALGARARRRQGCGSPRRRRSGQASGASARARPGRRPAAAARSTRVGICGSSSSASSSVQYSFTSTWSGRSRTLPYGLHAGEVEPVAAAELELQPLEPARARPPPRAPGHVVGVAEPDRPRGRRPCPPQPEQLVDGNAGELALQVVQRRIERRPSRGLARRQPRGDLVERPRVVPELDALEPGEPRSRRLARTARSARPRRIPTRRRAGSRPRRPRPRPATRARSRTSRRAAGRRSGQSTSTGYTTQPPAPVAQGIERSPPERKVAGSIPAGRTELPGRGNPDFRARPPRR